MISVIVSESVIQCILDFYAKNNEVDYQMAKACQDSHEKDMTGGVSGNPRKFRHSALWNFLGGWSAA